MNSSFNVKNGINISSGGTGSASGDITVNTNRLQFHNGTLSDSLVSQASTDTLTNKTLSAGGTNVIGSTAISGTTGSGSVVFSASPTFSGAVCIGSTTQNNSAVLTTLGSISARSSGADGTFTDAIILAYSGNNTDHSVIQHSSSILPNSSGFRFKATDGAGTSTTTVLDLTKGQTIFYTGGTQRASIDSSGNFNVVNLTASRAVVSDGSKNLSSSATTASEIGFVSGVTSAIQTQLNTKATSAALTSHTGASSGVHGVTGSVVGTSDTQTLTNKTITSASLDGTTNVSGILGIGQSTGLVGTNEQLINAFNTTATTSPNIALSSRLTLSGNTSTTQLQRGAYLELRRTITSSTTDNATITGAVARFAADVAAGQTLTNSASNGYTSLGIVSLVQGGGSVASNYSGINLFDDSNSFTGVKVGLRFGSFTGGTSNAFISDGVAFTGNYAINIASTNPSSLGGNLIVGGNVGVGVTSPGEKLDVSGNIKVRGASGLTKVLAGGSLTGLIVSGANTTFTISAVNGTGMFIVVDATNGASALVFYGFSNSLAIVSQTTSEFAITATPSATQTGIQYVSSTGVLTVYNGFASSRQYAVNVFGS